MGKTSRTTPLFLIFLALWLMGCELPGPAGPPGEPAEPAGAIATLVPTAAPVAALPDPEPTDVPTPTPPPTVDPSLPEWTILIFMAADNNLDPQALANLNQLEEAGSSPEVNVIVQLDRAAGAEWSDVRRYEITGDADRQAIQSTLLAELGELNSGEPGVLADFIAWGMDAYPAKKTALLLWNHGSGWSGVATDDSSGDILTLPELAAALEWGLANRPDRRLDLVGFDACLMGQLDVYTAVAPYAAVAVASEELIPARGWAYDAWLSNLHADPSQDGRQAAAAAVTTFLDAYRETDPFVTLAAVDLVELPAVNGALLDLTTALREEPALAAGPLATARFGAEQFARAYRADGSGFGTLDLRHFAAILAERSLTPALRDQAAALAAAVDRAVILAGQGSGFQQASGIAIYFPADLPALSSDYAAVSTVSGWHPFLNDYYQTGRAALTPPQVAVTWTGAGETAAPTSAQDPAHLAFQITGREIDQVTLLAGRYEDNGEKRLLLEVDPLIPEPLFLADGTRLYEWRDGLHEDFFIWNTRVTFLSDGTDGQYVVLWPVDETPAGGQRRAVQGSYYPPGSESGLPARLIFDGRTRQIDSAWGLAPGSAPFELIPQPGARFQPDRIYLDENDQLVTLPGSLLTLNPEGQLTYDWRPVPSGSYFIGFQARNAAGESGRALVDLTVDNAILAGDAAAYLDPYLGFQFLHPPDWYRPVYDEQILFTTSQDGRTRLRITLFPEAGAVSAETLKAETLEVFGPIQILYEESRVVAERPAEVTAYGYAGADGERTGLFATFVRDGVGYVVDLDGPREQEGATLAVWAALLDSWRYRPIGQGLFPNRWATLETDSGKILRPEAFLYQETENGWQRFTSPDDGHIFVALRREDAAGSDEQSQLERWSAVAAGGVTAFQQSDSGRFVLGGQLWLRRNFTYEASDGRPIRGFIMVAGRGEQEIVAWAEAPAAVYEGVEQSIFEAMLAELP